MFASLKHKNMFHSINKCNTSWNNIQQYILASVIYGWLVLCAHMARVLMWKSQQEKSTFSCSTDTVPFTSNPEFYSVWTIYHKATTLFFSVSFCIYFFLCASVYAHAGMHTCMRMCCCFNAGSHVGHIGVKLSVLQRMTLSPLILIFQLLRLQVWATTLATTTKFLRKSQYPIE